MLQIILEYAGAAVIVATTVPEARSMLGGFRPDVVVMEMHLGEQDWPSLLQDGMNRENRLTFLAVCAEGVDQQRLRQLGFAASIRTPLDPGLLVEAILSAVDQRRPVQRSSW